MADVEKLGILRCLQRMDGAVAEQRLLADVWGCNLTASTHTLATCIYRLRQKIEADPSDARLPLTTNVGYRLATTGEWMRRAEVRVRRCRRRTACAHFRGRVPLFRMTSCL